MKNSLLSHTSVIADRIQAALDEYHQRTQVEFEKEMLDSVRKMVVSGKLMRGNLVVRSALALGYQGDGAALIQVAAGIELIGSGILVMDDVIDQDEMRRGQPTIHRHWIPIAQERGWVDSKHSGESVALCLDVLLMFLGQKLMSTKPILVEKQGKLASISSDMIIRLGLAEAHELQVSLVSNIPTLPEIEQLYIDKSGNYSVAWPLLLGGVLAGVDQVSLNKLEQIGQQIGLIFQIRDDWLNLYGDPAITGKSTLSDVTNKKKTWFLALLLEFLPEKDRQQVMEFYHSTANQPDKLDEVLKYFQRPEFIDFLDQKVAVRVAEVQDIITGSTLPEDCRQLLSQLLEFVASREK